jgi:hypothetical protein
VRPRAASNSPVRSKRRRVLGLAAALLACSVSSSEGQDAGLLSAGVGVPGAKPQAVAVPIGTDLATAVRLDGDLSEAVWDKAQPITTFLQREPTEGAPPTFQTEARVAYDDTALYIAVRARDEEPDKILGFLTRRDAGSASDWIRVIVDSYRDRRTAYEFAVNPVGVKQDSYRYNDGDSDDSWDAVWEVAVARADDGWRAEFRIPYSQLRFSDSDEKRLGFAVVRHVARLNETATWPLLPRSAVGYVSSFGDLAGVVRPGGLKRLELVPYVVGQVATEPRQHGNPLQRIPDPGASIGVDLKYAVTPALSLTATVNPDFGQVEADPAVVNLGAFEQFFSERRPFFVEGSGTYQFGCGDGCDLFYSRRIGRAPRGTPTTDGEFASRTSQSTILGAGKLTGRIGGFSVGVLTAVTQEEQAQVAFGDLASSRRTEVVEPQTFYSVSRARREFSDQSSLGFMLTTANRGRVASLAILPDAAAGVGVDYDWRIGRRWNLSGYAAGSRVGGSRQAISALQRSNVHSYQRPDADHVEFDPLAESMRGHAGRVAVGKIAGQRTRMNLGVGYTSPGFDVNETGFQRRADEISQNGWLQVRWDTPGRFVRNRRLNFNQWSGRNTAGDLLSLGGNVNGQWTFQNLWSAGFGANLNKGVFDDRKTRGGPGGLFNPSAGSWQFFNTNDRKTVSFHWNSGVGVDWQGRLFGSEWRGRVIELQPSVQVRPTSSLSVSVGLSHVRNIDDAQWIRALREAEGTRYVFGRLNQTTASVTTRVNYTLTPTLSIQLYAQPFVSAGHYENYKEMVDGRAARHDDRYRQFAYVNNADFNVLSFRTTNVLRWEFKPGSTLFAVWQQGREGYTQQGGFRFGRDFGDTFATPSSNTVLVKLAYWMNP